MKTEYYEKVNKKVQLAYALIILLIIIGEGVLIISIYQFNIIPQQKEFCDEMSIELGKSCSRILEKWCMINETKRDEIKFTLDNKIEGIENRFLNR